MIKVITLSNKGWNTHSLDPNIDPENITDNDPHWYENLALDNFINNGWTIQDWKMSNTEYDCFWTFVLYKQDSYKSEETEDLPTDILKKLNYENI